MSDLDRYLTDEAVEKAAQVLHDLRSMRSLALHEVGQPLGDTVYDDERRADARAALEAVAEDMRRDEYHTMDELYEYRMLYNALAANALAHLAVKSWRHSDGQLCFGGGWFVVYLNLPTGQVSNHYRAEHWDLFNVPEADTAPEYDGHTPAEAAERLKAAAPALEAVYADIKAEALREAAAELERLDDGRVTGYNSAGRHIIARLRARADRIEARDE